jgi:Nucleoside-diphosphate-sugar pyrophosphorylase involved in lipopolysaccharide biosynthesis/translation initiation factor 2B, gamma/epsilon subunits (eIF-2Bgamma/eIF-2Bepsilon)
MVYRNLTPLEIETLTGNGCVAENWDDVIVHNDFSPEYIRRVTFSGRVKMGIFKAVFTLPGGLKKHSGITRAYLHNCEIGNDVLIENVQNYIANYRIGNNVRIQNVHYLYVEGESAFGNGVEVSVLNETGGREVVIYDKLSAHFAYILSFYRHRPLLVKKMQDMVRCYAAKRTSSMGAIGDNVVIVNAGAIKNVYIGDNAKIEGARHLENGSINSNSYDPVHIGYSVMANDFIICSGSHIEDGTMLTRCFVGQACHLGHTYSAGDSLFFSNCRGENGEAYALFAGPYTVTHHKSTLLISGMFSFMNAGSGSNQSNHMYKLGPIHQGIVERGGKTTSNSYILWPARIGAFSLIMGRHYHNSDTSDMPFSYLIEDKNESVLVPGVNLRSVGTIRDAQKFPKRDRRKDLERLDQINFNLLSPYTVQKMFKAQEILKNLQHNCGETSGFYTYQSCRIKSSSLKNGIKLYNMAIVKFLGNSIISRLKDCPCSSDEAIRADLKPDTSVGLNEWSDIGGLLAPRSEIERLIDGIESGEIKDVDTINNIFVQLHQDYYSLEWTWAWSKIEQYFGVSLETITAEDIISIVTKWKEAVVNLDKMIYEDAKKEFSLSSHTGFGVDGDRAQQKDDFEQVRGLFEENVFVETVMKHIKTKSELGDEIVCRLRLEQRD